MKEQFFSYFSEAFSGGFIGTILFLAIEDDLTWTNFHYVCLLSAVAGLLVASFRIWINKNKKKNRDGE